MRVSCRVRWCCAAGAGAAVSMTQHHPTEQLAGSRRGCKTVDSQDSKKFCKIFRVLWVSNSVVTDRKKFGQDKVHVSRAQAKAAHLVLAIFQSIVAGISVAERNFVMEVHVHLAAHAEARIWPWPKHDFLNSYSKLHVPQPQSSKF